MPEGAAGEPKGRVEGPTRTCVGCRRRAPQRELRRFVALNGEVVPDPDRRLPGRGAWLHDDPTCRELAEKRRAFTRALRLGRP